MPAPFRRLTPREFEAEVASFAWCRRVWRVDMHHTWFPAHADYEGIASIERMARFHTNGRGFDDIAQHVSIAPDGNIWTGRDWNKDPASVGFGMNAGVFMFEAIGNFDWGFDRLEGRQLDSVVRVINVVQTRFRLPVQALLFHREVPQTAKTCPGASVEKQQILKLVAGQRRRPQPVDHGANVMVA
ncbi:MAG: peptidoglycan recognition family protein [Hyphomicrobiaceae bacterium]